MRRFCCLVVVVLLASALAGCKNRALGPGEARLKITSGRAQVAAEGEGWKSAHSDQRLHRGERVRVLQGLAEVEFSDDRSLELREGSEVRVLAQPELLSGDVLTVAKDRTLVVNAGTAEARVRRGASHVVRGLTATAASYNGDLVVSSAGRVLTVPALRQAGVPGPGLVPNSPTPLVYRPENPWDRRYLGEAMELGDALQARSKGFTAQLGPDEGRTPGFYAQLIPALDRESGYGPQLLDPNLLPGDTLVGAAITVEGTQGNFIDRWRSVFSFRTQGAEWGLVALDQKVSSSGLLTEVDEALGRRSVGTAAAAPGSPAAQAPIVVPTAPVVVAPAAGADGPDGGSEGGGGGGSGGGGGGRSPTTTVPPIVPPPPEGPGLPPILGGPQPPGSPPTSAPNPIGGLIQGVGNVAGGLLGGLLNPRG